MLREQTDPGATVRYLSLGVFAQRVVERLVKLEPQDFEPLRQQLGDALRAIELVEAPNSKVGAPARPEGLPFQDYEQLSTLFDVVGGTHRTAVSAKLADLRVGIQQLMRNPASNSPARTALLDVFRRLATEALARSHRPARGLSRRTLELCQP